MPFRQSKKNSPNSPPGSCYRKIKETRSSPSLPTSSPISWHRSDIGTLLFQFPNLQKNSQASASRFLARRKKNIEIQKAKQKITFVKSGHWPSISKVNVPHKHSWRDISNIRLAASIPQEPPKKFTYKIKPGFHHNDIHVKLSKLSKLQNKINQYWVDNQCDYESDDESDYESDEEFDESEDEELPPPKPIRSHNDSWIIVSRKHNRFHILDNEDDDDDDLDLQWHPEAPKIEEAEWEELAMYS
jgi:hypothetical protein